MMLIHFTVFYPDIFSRKALETNTFSVYTLQIVGLIC
jgi:hypothetical protein